ncbi:prenyltransferase/squalene oxidase repeat-containing protein [Lentzea sp. NPDC058450]|uniref:prenyltransferase/squalene oxidase repeat-containing protein n=1 Tax=Lentzea sp. NPDC058450 TaxID=3346505 RepID=UPI003654A82D
MTAVVSPPGVGVAVGGPDLWCTYAAVRTLAWLGRVDTVQDVAGTAAFLSGRANADGGYAWSKGMPSDAWATFYCTQALRDLGLPVPGVDRTTAWLDRTWTGEAYAMTPGQEPDVWATHFSTRTAVTVCGIDVPDRARLLDWLAALQTADGGLSWSPDHARAGGADVRACHYGAAAWKALNSLEPALPPWDVPALVRWLNEQQSADGGFRFAEDAEVPCMWATYRATAALDALGHRPDQPVDEWVTSLRRPGGAFVRWQGYDVEDVWASFCAVGSLQATGSRADHVADAVVARLAELACPGGGHTYREPAAAADALATAAAVLIGRTDAERGRRWLEGCQLPNEGGVMYMPGRGSEVRCTLWALAAGAFQDDPAGADRVLTWLRAMQNPDGGFGFWEGRGSDLVSTSAAVESVRLLGGNVAEVLDVAALKGFTDTFPSGTLRSGLQALRVRQSLGSADSQGVRLLLTRHHVRGGGWANEGSRMPDLLSTYEAVATADRHGVEVDTDHLGRFVRRVHTDRGTAWSPLAPPGGDALADCLGTLLHRRLHDGPGALPALTLS